MRDFLTQFNMTVVHCPGIWNNADSISRLEPNFLPSELAQSLHSATTAVMKGKSTLISLGTSTEEDRFTSGQDRIQPNAKPVPEDGSHNGPAAKVLCTKADLSPDYVCLLCSLDENSEDPPSEEDELIHEKSTVFKTDAEILELEDEVDWIKVSHLGPHFEPELLRKEAQKWNERHLQNSLASWPYQAADQTIPDLEDLEDLLWCDELNRKAVVLRVAAAARFRQRHFPLKTVTFNLEPNDPEKSV
jgi:hypothetical protein